MLIETITILRVIENDNGLTLARADAIQKFIEHIRKIGYEKNSISYFDFAGDPNPKDEDYPVLVTFTMSATSRPPNFREGSVISDLALSGYVSWVRFRMPFVGTLCVKIPDVCHSTGVTPLAQDTIGADNEIGRDL